MCNVSVLRSRITIAIDELTDVYVLALTGIKKDAVVIIKGAPDPKTGISQKSFIVDTVLIVILSNLKLFMKIQQILLQRFQDKSAGIQKRKISKYYFIKVFIKLF